MKLIQKPKFRCLTMSQWLRLPTPSEIKGYDEHLPLDHKTRMLNESVQLCQADNLQYKLKKFFLGSFLIFELCSRTIREINDEDGGDDASYQSDV